ncbi:MAG: hypothetical protein KC912_20225 [Proteobacteria bacterium]|nr:hypothetical protein [Pseudomonadota bacterium]
MRSLTPLLLLALIGCSENGLGEPVGPNVGVDSGGDTGVTTDSGEPFPDTDGGSMDRPEESDTDTDTDTDADADTDADTDSDTDVDTSDPTEREETDNVDSVTQPAEFAVDVLWVVDNSCSMDAEQTSLAANFPSFIDAFLAMDGLNYHVGVVSTDMDSNNHSGRLREADGARWLDVNSPTPYTTFNDMALMGTGGSGDEAGRAAAYAAVTDPLRSGYNAGFLRDEAALAVIIISDEDDSSGQYNVSQNNFVTMMQGLKPDPAMVSFSTIVGPDPNGCTSADAGSQYHNVRNQLGGVNASICDANWAQVLDDLAANAASLRREFFLDDIPDPTTIQVWVIEQNGTRIDLVNGTDFTYNAQRNSVQLTSYTPAPFAEIFVAYDLRFGAGN